MVVSNKNIIVKIMISVLLISIVYITYKIIIKPENIELDEVKLKDEVKIDKSKTLAIMLQNDTGEYTKSESSAFPTTGYRFNSTKSGCVDVNGNIIESSLTYNNETNKVNLRINRKAICYVYFDLIYYTITNLVQNGSFENGLDNWTNVDTTQSNSNSITTAYKLYGDNSVSRIANTSDSGRNYLLQDISFIAGHTYYFFLYAYTPSLTSQFVKSDINSRGGSINLNITSANGWVKGSSIMTNYPYTEQRSISVNYQITSDYTYVDGIGMIDLTEAFGKGNEPDKSWCDENIDYFDGSIEVHK